MKQKIVLLLMALVFIATANAQTTRKTKATNRLFGRRSDVKDAHDRYATQDTGYLQIKAPPQPANAKKNAAQASCSTGETMKLLDQKKDPLCSVKKLQTIQSCYCSSV